MHAPVRAFGHLHYTQTHTKYVRATRTIQVHISSPLPAITVIYPGTRGYLDIVELLVVEGVNGRAQVACRQVLVLVSIVVLDVVRIIAGG